MKFLKVQVWMFLFAAAGASSLMAAPAASNTNAKNTTGIVLGGNNTDTTIDPSKGQPKPVTGTGVMPVAEGNSIAGSVTVDKPRRVCYDYQYVGPNARPLETPDGKHACPPGYDCHTSGIVLECRLSGGITPTTVVYADESRCVTARCTI